MECGRPARLDAPNHSISFDADTIAKALVNIYQKKYGNGSPDIEPTLFEKTKEILSGAVNKGVAGQRSGKTSDAFIHALTHNTTVFSVFRVLNMQSKIASYLVDSKGKLKPFGQFVKDVEPYITHQNRQWLQTEYDTTVRRAHLAADWQRFEDEKDVLPNLEWKPSTSPNPGEDHKPYWGTILPIDHEFWNQHRPGDRWNCKCSLRNTDKPATSVPAETVASAQPQKGLDSNPGTTGEIFSTSHPYFPENCGKCPFNKGVGKLFAALVGKGIHCNDCVKVEKAISQTFIEERRKEYEQYKNDPDYLDVVFNEETGGLKARHRGHKRNSRGDRLFGLRPYEIEDAFQNTIYEMGGSCIFLNEDMKRPNGETARGLDTLVNGILTDIRTVSKPTTNIRNCITDKHEQLVGFNNDFDTNASTMCLFYYDDSFYTEEKVKKGILDYVRIARNWPEGITVKEILVVLRNQKQIIKYEVK